MSTATISVLALALAAPPAAAEGASPGDLTAERAEAEAARKAAPSAATWAREAEACERLADYACAREARAQQKALAAEGSPERAQAEARLAALGDMSRGTVGDEPASKRRAENDRMRDKPAPKIVKPTPQVDKLAPARREPIVKKWYFWVTMIAIAASGAAITAIAVDAARDEQKGVQPITEPARAHVGPGGFGLRF